VSNFQFTEIKLFECPELTTLDFFFFLVWMQSEVYIRNMDTPNELLARVLDAAACIKKRKDQLRRTTRDLRTRVAKCTEADGGIFEHLL
jgi:hypothetical protein